MEVARQRVRATVACKKEKEKTQVGESSLALKAIGKGAAKRKANGKDECPSNKVSVILGEKLPKKLSPPKHGASKGLITTLGPVTQDSEHCLLTHKDYAVEMFESIIKDKDVDPCVGQATGELGDLGLYDLGRVSIFHSFFYLFIFILTN